MSKPFHGSMDMSWLDLDPLVFVLEQSGYEQFADIVNEPRVNPRLARLMAMVPPGGEPEAKPSVENL